MSLLFLILLYYNTTLDLPCENNATPLLICLLHVSSAEQDGDLYFRFVRFSLFFCSFFGMSISKHDIMHFHIHLQASNFQINQLEWKKSEVLTRSQQMAWKLLMIKSASILSAMKTPENERKNKKKSDWNYQCIRKLMLFLTVICYCYHCKLLQCKTCQVQQAGDERDLAYHPSKHGHVIYLYTVYTALLCKAGVTPSPSDMC